MLKKIKNGLSKTRKNILTKIKTAFTFNNKINTEFLEELEEILITADLGIRTVTDIIDEIEDAASKNKLNTKEELFAFVENKIKILFDEDEKRELKLTPTPAVIILVGINGTGKTTTAAKLAYKLKQEGKKVLLTAADTFRAAAIEQLEIWGKRANVPVIKQMQNSDPGAVVYDAINSAIAKKLDVVIIDTAGRLHTKKHLMDEMSKIQRIVEKLLPHSINEILIVLDATTGQNAISQAKLFKETVDLSGIVLTKLDGTAKGGIVVAIKRELDLPVKFIGIGEKMDDLEKFNSEEYVKAIFED